MSYEMEVSLRVVVNNDDEAMRLMEAVYSGLAADVLRMGVLYGQVSAGGAVQGGTAPLGGAGSDRDALARRKKEEQEVEIKDVELHVGKADTAIEPQQAKRPLRRSLSGVKRMGRA